MLIEKALQQASEEAINKGRLTLSISTTSEGYQANLTTDGKSWRVEMAADAYTALLKVLGLVPGAAGGLRQFTNDVKPVDDFSDFEDLLG